MKIEQPKASRAGRAGPARRWWPRVLSASAVLALAGLGYAWLRPASAPDAAGPVAGSSESAAASVPALPDPALAAETGAWSGPSAAGESRAAGSPEDAEAPEDAGGRVVSRAEPASRGSAEDPRAAADAPARAEDVELERVLGTALVVLAPGAGADADRQLEAIDELLAVGLGGELQEPAVAGIVEALRDAALQLPPEVAEPAVEALGDLDTPLSLPALAEILASGAPEEVKLAAIDAITSVDAPGAALALSRGLTDPSPAVRDEAAWGLAWVEDRDPAGLAALMNAARGETDEQVLDTMIDAIEDYKE